MITLPDTYEGQSQLLWKVQDDRIEQLKLHIQEPEKHRPLSTSFRGIDKMLNGGLPRLPFMFTLIGDRKAGKTTIELNIALGFCATFNEPTALYMLEEAEYQVADRTLAMRSSVSRKAIFNLDLTLHNRDETNDFDALSAAMASYQDVPFYVNDSLYRVEDIYADMRALGVRRGVIDNAQLLQGGKGYDERTQFVWNSQYIMHQRKQGISTFLISQENDKGKTSGSQQFIADSDLVMRIDRVLVDPGNKKSGYMENMRELVVTYSRYSPEGARDTFFFDGAHSRLTEWEAKDPEETAFAKYMEDPGDPGE